MSLKTIDKNLANIKARIGSVFVERTDGTSTSWVSLGEVADVQVNWEVVRSGRDTAGREIPLALDVTVQLVMKQTTETEFEAARELMLVNDPYYPNGWRIKITEKPATPATADTTPGIIFENVVPSIDGNLNFMGEDSTLPMSFGGRVSIEELNNLATNNKITFDA